MTSSPRAEPVSVPGSSVEHVEIPSALVFRYRFIIISDVSSPSSLALELGRGATVHYYCSCYTGLARCTSRGDRVACRHPTRGRPVPPGIGVLSGMGPAPDPNTDRLGTQALRALRRVWRERGSGCTGGRKWETTRRKNRKDAPGLCKTWALLWKDWSKKK